LGDGPPHKPPRFPIDLAPEQRRTVDEVARDYVRTILEVFRGNQTNAARALGIDRKTLARNLARWRLSVPLAPRVLEPGSLVAIEGIDGSGITTQVDRLVRYLCARGHKAIATAEPSAGPIGALLRDLLAKPSALAQGGAMRTLSLLFAADRLDHYQRVVAPALANQVTVVSDRWYHSSLAYQRTGVERDWISTLHRHTRTPDVTFVLEVRPETGQQRREAAGRRTELFHAPAIQREIVAGYRATVAELRLSGERIEVVDGEAPIDAVFAVIARCLRVPRGSPVNR
jgi:dTMP kinase